MFVNVLKLLQLLKLQIVKVQVDHMVSLCVCEHAIIVAAVEVADRELAT